MHRARPAHSPAAAAAVALILVLTPGVSADASAFVGAGPAGAGPEFSTSRRELAFARCADALKGRSNLTDLGPRSFCNSQGNEEDCLEHYYTYGEVENNVLLYKSCQWLDPPKCKAMPDSESCSLDPPPSLIPDVPTPVPATLTGCSAQLQGKVNVRQYGERVFCSEQKSPEACAKSYMTDGVNPAYTLCTWLEPKCKGGQSFPCPQSPTSIAPSQQAMGPTVGSQQQQAAAVAAAPALTAQVPRPVPPVTAVGVPVDAAALPSLLMYAAAGMLTLAILSAIAAWWYTTHHAVGGPLHEKDGDDGEDDDEYDDDDDDRSDEGSMASSLPPTRPLKRGQQSSKTKGPSGIPKRALHNAHEYEVEALAPAADQHVRSGARKKGLRKAVDAGYSMDDDNDQYSAV